MTGGQLSALVGESGSAVSGTISPVAAGAGATVNLGGAATGTTTADASGHFSFAGLANGTYAVMPGKAGYTFTPTSRSFTLSGAEVTGLDFTASAAQPTYTIAGTLSPSAGGAGATVVLSGADNRTVTSDASGAYAFSGLANGVYTVTPSRAGYTFTPVSRTVTVSDADSPGVNFTAALGSTTSRANSYDNAWKMAWVTHARSLMTPIGKTDGFVLQLGDSITHTAAYALWPQQGLGQTATDAQVIAWSHATSWGTGNSDVANKNGWYLAAADTTAQRGLTASSGLTTGELMAGCCNGGPAMSASSDPETARQLLADATYTSNLQIDTVIAAFADAQFAVVMLGTNDPTNPRYGRGPGDDRGQTGSAAHRADSEHDSAAVRCPGVGGGAAERGNHGPCAVAQSAAD